MKMPTTSSSAWAADLVAEMNRTISIELLPSVAKSDQVAKVIQTSVDALAQDRYRGRGIPFVKVGGRVRYLRDDVLAYLAANRSSGDAA
jgi:hypothetical protein